MIFFCLVTTLNDFMLQNISFLDERAETNGCVNDDDEEQCSMGSDINNDSEEEWDSHDNQYHELHSPDTIINNKSTKAIYKAVAKQWGITCKMSEQCRCMECQSNYFDCEFDDVSKF